MVQPPSEYSVTPPALAIVHDYLTQPGGAERVVLTLASAWPEASIHTSLYDPEGTFPEFSRVAVVTSPLNRIGPLRHRHRLALPLLAPAFSRMVVESDVALCSSSGWAHGVQAHGRKVVYCHTPARWLYQADRYLEERSGATAGALALLAPGLRRWDQQAARSADRYLVNSRVVADRVATIYGIDAEVVPPPVDIDVGATQDPDPSIEPGFLLCVARLLPYKNTEAVVEALNRLPAERLVLAGSGPLVEQLRQRAPANVTVTGRVSDARLRWLYRNCSGLLAASYEDFGLTPIEAARFGQPTVALHWGGFLDTIVEGETGVYFAEPTPDLIAEGVRKLRSQRWSAGTLVAHAERYSAPRFIERIGAIVDEERRLLG